jgi:hypothetical protein
MTADLAAAVVQEELGAPPERAFARWDPLPIAAASIGLVHRAVTHDGRAVAVKVQYPGIADAMAADLRTSRYGAGSFASPRRRRTPMRCSRSFATAYSRNLTTAAKPPASSASRPTTAAIRPFTFRRSSASCPPGGY